MKRSRASSLRLLLLGSSYEPWEPTLTSARKLVRRTTLLLPSGIVSSGGAPADDEDMTIMEAQDEAAALNSALEGMEEEWALILRAGETLEGKRGELPKLLLHKGRRAYIVDVISAEAAVPEVRLVRQQVRFQYPLWPEPLLQGEPGLSGLVVRPSQRERERHEFEAMLEGLAALPEGHPHRLYHRINLLFALRRYEEILALVEALEEAEGGKVSLAHGDAYFTGVRALLNLGRVREARGMLDRGLDVYPDSVDLNYGMTLLGALEFMDAAQSTLDPRHPLYRHPSSTRRNIPVAREFLAGVGLKRSS